MSRYNNVGVISYNGSRMIYSWHEEIEAEFLDRIVERKGAKIQRLRLKLSRDGNTKFKIEAEEK